jgi:hypothetical protein
MAIESKSIIDQNPVQTRESYFAMSKIELLEKDHSKVTELIGSIRRLAKHTGRLSNYIYESELDQLLEDKLPVDLEKQYFLELVHEETTPRELRKNYIAYMKAKMDFVRKVMKLYARLNRDYIAFQKVNKKLQTTSKKPKNKGRKPVQRRKTVQISEKKGKQATLLKWK